MPGTTPVGTLEDPSLAIIGRFILRSGIEDPISNGNRNNPMFNVAIGAVPCCATIVAAENRPLFRTRQCDVLVRGDVVDWRLLPQGAEGCSEIGVGTGREICTIDAPADGATVSHKQIRTHNRQCR